MCKMYIKIHTYDIYSNFDIIVHHFKTSSYQIVFSIEIRVLIMSIWSLNILGFKLTTYIIHNTFKYIMILKLGTYKYFMSNLLIGRMIKIIYLIFTNKIRNNIKYFNNDILILLVDQNKIKIFFLSCSYKKKVIIWT